MKVKYRHAFIKDLKKLKGSDAYDRIYTVAFNTLPASNNLQELSNIKVMQGYSNRYRIRVGNYRIGIEAAQDRIEIVRVLHRKEFYRYFP